LAQNAIHGQMAGFTNFTTTKLNGKTIFLPMAEGLGDQVTFYI